MLTQQHIGAALLVALTSAADKKAQTSAAVARNSISDISTAAEDQVFQIWENASKESLSFMRQVLANNPQKTPADILVRPDVQEALQYPFLEAATQSETILRQAWFSAMGDAIQKAKGEAKLLGVDAGSTNITVPDDLLVSVIDDFYRNAHTMSDRVTAALNAEDKTDALTKVYNDQPRRAKYGVHMAVWGVGSEVRDLFAKVLKLNRVWVSRKDTLTCTHCLDLDGTVVRYDEPFPVPDGARIYGDVLLGPPLHPHCRCRDVLTLLAPTG